MTTTILLCTYNGESFLEDQLNSYLGQTELPTDLYVADDGSTDNTLSILKAFADKAPFPVQIHQNKEKLGYAKNFLTHLQHTTGDLVFLSDQDDIWLSTKIEMHKREFVEDPFLALTFSNAELIDETNTIIAKDYFSYLSMIDKWDNLTPDLFAFLLKNNTFVNGCFMTVSKKVRHKISAFFSDYPNYELEVGHDQFIAMLVSLVFPHDFVREVLRVLTQHRKHDTQTMGNEYGETVGVREIITTKQLTKRAHIQQHINHLQRMLGLATLLKQNDQKEQISRFLSFHQSRLQQADQSLFSRSFFVFINAFTFNYHKRTQFPLKEMSRDLL